MSKHPRSEYERQRRRERDKARRRKRYWPASWRKKKLAITPELYVEKVKACGGKCEICGRVPNYKLHVDHDHRTNEVRGLLCARCNSSVGWLESHLPVIVNYLRRTR